MMKNFMVSIGLIFTLTGNATIEDSGKKPPRPTTEEISANRSCFEKLKSLGCGDPGDDIRSFRGCMSIVYSGLPDKCKKLMKDLYL